MRARDWVALGVSIGLTATCVSPTVSPNPAATASAEGSTVAAASSPGGSPRPRTVSIEVLPDPPRAGALLVVAVHGLSPGERVSIEVAPGGSPTEVRTTVDGLARFSVVLGDEPATGWTITVRSAGDTVASRSVSSRSASAAAPSSPGSPALATRPPVGLSPPSLPPAVRTLPPVGSAPPAVPGSFALAGGFPGIDGYDAAIAVGPNVVVLQTNDVIELREKSGPIIASRSAASFYGAVTVPNSIGTFDGVLQYDPLSTRFFHLAATRTNDRSCTPGTCVAALYFAVSKTSNPRTLGPDDWYTYALDNAVIQDTPTDSWGDEDGIAVSDAAVVLTTNVWAYRDDAFRGMKLRILEKAPLLRGEAIRGWRDLFIPAVPGAGDTNMRPIVAYGDPSRLLFVSDDQVHPCDNIRIWNLTDPLGTPALESRTVSYPQSCGGAAKGLQPSGPLLDVFGQWPQPVYRLGSLWVATQFFVNVPGDNVAAIRWLEIDVRSWPSVRIVQSGMLAEAGISYMYPSIAVDASGDMSLSFIRSSGTEFPSAAYSGRLAGDPLGTLRPVALLKQGEGVHDCRNTASTAGGAFGTNKIADYTNATIDPVDSSAWMLVHYVSTDRCKVPTWLGRLDWSVVATRIEPAPPAVARLRVEFTDQVDAADRAEIITDLPIVAAFLRSTFGSDVLRDDAVRVRSGESATASNGEVLTACCNTDPRGDVAYFDTAHRDWSAVNASEPTAAATHLHVLAHEYTHLWQAEQGQAGCLQRPAVGYVAPRWILEGVAEFSGFRIELAQQLATLTQIEDVRFANVRRFPVSVRRLEGSDWPSAPDTYGAAYAAVVLLARDSGTGSLRTFCESVGNGAAWPAAFQRTFGVTIEEFYARFEQWLGS